VVLTGVEPDPIRDWRAGRWVMIGVNWEVSQLRKISSALLGTVDIVPDPQGLEAEIVAMTDSAMSKTAARMHLRLRPWDHGCRAARRA
jgi:hypothetical protein